MVILLGLSIVAVWARYSEQIAAPPRHRLHPVPIQGEFLRGGPSSASAFSSQNVMPISRYIGCGRQVPSAPARVARAPVELAEAEVAVGDERAHAELGGQGQWRRRSALRPSPHRDGQMRGNLAEEAEGPRLVAAFTALAGERHGAVGARAGVLDRSASRYASPSCTTLIEWQLADPRGFVGCQGLLQPGDALLDASRPRVHVPQRRHRDRSQERDVPIAALSDRAFE